LSNKNPNQEYPRTLLGVGYPIKPNFWAVGGVAEEEDEARQLKKFLSVMLCLFGYTHTHTTQHDNENDDDDDKKSLIFLPTGASARSKRRKTSPPNHPT